MDLQVGGGVAVVGLEPGLPAHRRGPFPGGGADGFHHERTRRQLGQRSLAPAGRGDEAKFVGQQVVSLGLARARQGMSRVLLAEDDVEFAGYEGRQGHLGLKLDYLDAEPGVPLPELSEGVRYEGEDRGLEGGDAQRADGLGQGLGECGFGSFHRFQQHLGVGDEEVGLGGQPDAAAGRLEQAHPGLLLQRGELLGHRGRAVGQRLGHGGDGAAAGELTEQPQAPEVEHRASSKHQFYFTLPCPFSRWT